MFWGASKPEHTDGSKQQAIQDLRSKLAPTDVFKQLLAGQEPGISSTGLDDLTLTRWLTAEDWNVAKAYQRLCQHAPWRAQNFPAGRILEKDIKSELEGKKSYLQGVDKQGRAVSIILASKHSKSKRNLEETKRLICYCLDASIDRCDLSRNPTGKVVAIFDLRGVHMDALDTSALHAVFDLMQNHYPERLGMLWMYEPSFLFNSIWKVVSPFIDAHTKAKIRFIGKEGQPELQSLIDPAVLPREVGGQAEMVPTQDAVTRMRAEHQHSHTSQPQHTEPALSDDQPSPQPLTGVQANSGNAHGARGSSAGAAPAIANTSKSPADQAAKQLSSQVPAERLPEQVAPAGMSASIASEMPAQSAPAQLKPSQGHLQKLSVPQPADPYAAEGQVPPSQPNSQVAATVGSAAASSPTETKEGSRITQSPSGNSTGQKIAGVFGKAKDKIVHPNRTV